ncbi:MAG: hypothetical protein ACRDM3_03565 [Rubrobacteraceae bacterium]
MATLSARFYTTPTGIFHTKTTGSEARKRSSHPSHEKPEITGRVSGAGGEGELGDDVEESGGGSRAAWRSKG